MGQNRIIVYSYIGFHTPEKIGVKEAIIFVQRNTELIFTLRIIDITSAYSVPNSTPITIKKQVWVNMSIQL